MEETKDKKISYEQLENVAMQLQQKCVMYEQKLKLIDMTATRLNYLFKVVEYEMSFNRAFVNKCTEEIENILTIEDDKKEEEKID